MTQTLSAADKIPDFSKPWLGNCCVRGCKETQFNGFFVCKEHALQITEPAFIRTVAWG